MAGRCQEVGRRAFQYGFGQAAAPYASPRATGELASVAQPVEDHRNQTLDGRLRGHCTGRVQCVKAKGRQFVGWNVSSDRTCVYGLSQQAPDDIEQLPLRSRDALVLMHQRPEF